YTQRELLEVIALTCTFAPFCELGKATDASDAMHPVDVDCDRGPGYLPEERTSASDGVLALKMGGLLAHIEAQVGNLPPGLQLMTFRMRGGPSVQADIDLAQRLVDGWTSDGTRGHARLSAGHTLESVIGLHDLHFVLCGNEDFDGFLRRLRGTSIQLSDQDAAASWATGASDQMRAQPLPVRIVDQSFGGYRVTWERGSHGEAVRTKVGELVGLSVHASSAQQPDWMVGVVRWMRIDDEGSIDAGIGLLARRSLAIGVNALDESGNLLNDRRGILLSPMRSEESAIYSSLLTPGLFEREPESIQLTLPIDPHRWPSSACTITVAGAGLMESAGAYLRFALPPLDLPDEGLEQVAESSLAESTTD
ncbi:hypothetical protein, partial [Dokdonella sp.]|uniref:hypothetical protein n=1 Tax=Dokdonella sp. TaxID=2291710 RepID=UPI003C47DC95